MALKAHRGTIGLRKNSLGKEHYLSFEGVHDGRRNPAYDGMADDTFRRALVFLPLRPLPPLPHVMRSSIKLCVPLASGSLVLGEMDGGAPAPPT